MVGENTCDRILIHASRRRAPSFIVPGLTCTQANEVINQRVARAGIETQSSSPSMYVTFATPPTLSTAMGCDCMSVRTIARWKIGDHGRALASRRKVGATEIIDDCNSEPRGQCRAVAELHAEPVLWPMHHRLAMKSHHTDRTRRDAIGSQKCFHSLRMHVCDCFLRRDQKLRATARSQDAQPPRSHGGPALSPGCYRVDTRSARDDRLLPRHSRSAPHRRRHKMCRSSAQSQSGKPLNDPRFQSVATCYTTAGPRRQS